MNHDHEKFEITSALICDDIRTERNGKEMLIGVYNDVMVVPELPWQIQKLCCRISLKIKQRKGERLAAFKLTAPTGEVLVELNSTIVAPVHYEDPILVGFLATILAPSAGYYVVSFAMDGDPLVDIHRFAIRQPLNQEEADRLS